MLDHFRDVVFAPLKELPHPEKQTGIGLNIILLISSHVLSKYKLKYQDLTVS